MNHKYQIKIEDFEMSRRPQTKYECHIIEAPSAADAAFIAQIRHNVPYSDTHKHTRRIIDIVPYPICP